MNTKKKILVVDDEKPIRELIRVNLEARGYKVALANNGSEAVALLESEQFELIILDVMMPDMDGWEVCKYIRDHPVLHEAKIIMLTARAAPKDKMIGLDILKANMYITKPFDIEYLSVSVQELLNEPPLSL
ncbi:MAG: response regulator [bacterium]